MRHIILVVAIALMLVLATGVVLAQKSTAPKPPATGVKEVSPVSDNALMDQASPYIADEPDIHFQKARENFLKRSGKASAEEIRTGAAYVKLEAVRAQGDSKKALIRSAQELDALADGVESGTVTSVKDLDSEFARADHALASHHYVKASEAWSKREAKKTGYEMRASANHLERSAAWVGHKTKSSTATVLKDTKTTGEKLIHGTGTVTSDVGKGINNLGKEIQEVGKKTGASKTSSSKK